MIGRPYRRSSDCTAQAEQLSALVDGSLGVADAERLTIHLVNCLRCAEEVAELRRLRRMLGGERSAEPAGPGPDVSGHLADRLVAIAGSDAAEPLRARALRPGGSRPLPSRRRSRQLLPTLSALALITMLGGVGLVAAPPTAAPIPDPTRQARSEFGSLAAQQPLASEPVAAVMLASQTAALSTTPVSAETARWLSHASLEQVSAPVATTDPQAILTRAAAADRAVSYRGTQLFTARVAGRPLTAWMRVQSGAGGGTRVEVYEPSGASFGTVYMPASPMSRVVDTEQLSLLADNYDLRAWSGARAAGRTAILVEATGRADVLSRGGTGSVAARWWVDADSGLLLWFETYDAGTATLAAGFTTVEIGSTEASSGPAATGTAPWTSADMTLAAAVGLADQGWICQPQIAALALVSARADDMGSPTLLQLAYSDGLATVAVFQQRGTLIDAPEGSTWDSGLGAYVSSGAPNIATWQSADLVFTVVTDGSSELLASAVSGLPHASVERRTTMERILAGWARIFDSLMG